MLLPELLDALTAEEAAEVFFRFFLALFGKATGKLPIGRLC